MRFSNLRSLAAFFFVTLMIAPAMAQDHAQAELLANVATIKPGEPFLLGIRFKIDPQWHIYWTNPGDSGLATEVKLKLPGGFLVGPVQYPVPSRLQLPGDIINYAYENEVMLTVQIIPPKNLSDKTITVGGKASWLVCNDNCMPGSAQLSLQLPVGDQAKPDNSELFKTWIAALPLPAINAPQALRIDTAYTRRSKDAGDLAAITIRWAITPADVQFLPDTLKNAEASNIKAETSGTTTAITFHVTDIGENLSFPGLITYANNVGQRVGINVNVDTLKAEQLVLHQSQ